ncbi:MAG TPA: carboxypeptidase-like regulatory domain-containing protein, partial [Terriglobales bacterium]|nr:carboxypeptidase-like regulatory domain-containing protein [Terriglobales bacterium]
MRRVLQAFDLQRVLGAAALLIILALSVSVSFAQSLLSGDITGTLTDTSGAVIPNAVVHLKSLDTGASQSTTSNASGYYRFNLLKPGRYTVSVNQTGFAAAQQAAVVAIGQATTINLQ